LPISVREPNSNAREQERVKTDLRALTGRLIRVQDEERKHLARDLHDGVGQLIALLKMNLDRLGSRAKLRQEPATLLTESLALVDTMARDLRAISCQLHPPLLDVAGLAPALRGLADGFSQHHGIQTSLKIDDPFGPLPDEAGISIYRIVQECLNNIQRHSGSPTARIRVERRNASIEIEIQDDGRGMRAEKSAAEPGVGLGEVRERAAQLGGTLEIKSDGQGTTVIARLPLSNAPSSNESGPATRRDGVLTFSR
jgi:two-component system NarL family sensor kinase